MDIAFIKNQVKRILETEITEQARDFWNPPTIGNFMVSLILQAEFIILTSFSRSQGRKHVYLFNLLSGNLLCWHLKSDR